MSLSCTHKLHPENVLEQVGLASTEVGAEALPTAGPGGWTLGPH